jgi:hypothetical protein
MKGKKSKFNFGPNGLKGFFLDHVEKMVLVLMLFVVIGFVYFGSTVETWPKAKTPQALAENVTRASAHINEKTWEKVKATNEPPSIVNPIVIRTKADDFKLGAIDQPILPSRSKRRDPNLYPPTQLEVYALTAAIAVMPSEDLTKLSPLDKIVQDILQKQAEEAAKAPLFPTESDRDKKKTKKGGAKAGEHDPFAQAGGPRGGAYGNTTNALGGTRQVDEEDREEYQRMGSRVANTAVAVSRNMIAVKALIPFKKQMAEYREALYGNPNYVNEERDVPTYVYFTVERADVTANPNADSKTLDWKVLSTREATRLPEADGAVWEQIPEELVDPIYTLPGMERNGAELPPMTLPIPPVLLTDRRKLAGHTEIPWAATSENLNGRMPTSDKKTVKPEKAEGPEGPEGPDEGPDSTKTGPSRTSPSPAVPRPPVRGEGGRRGYPSGYPGGRGRSGSSGSDAGLEEVTYKLFRFIDFNVERGHQYRYRVKLMLEDPNHPQAATGAQGAVVGRDGGKGNDPLPTALDKNVEQRLRDLKKEEDKTGKRKWYRETDWSEASPVVVVPDPLQIVGGAASPAHKQPVAGTNAMVTTSEPQTKMLVVSWDDLYAAHVSSEDDGLSRGSVLNFVKDSDCLHPVKLDYVTLKDYPVRTDAMIVDIRGGEKIAGGTNKELTVPGEVAYIDSNGKLTVASEAEDIKSWLRYAKVEPKKIEEPKTDDDKDKDKERNGYPEGPRQPKPPRTTRPR